MDTLANDLELSRTLYVPYKYLLQLINCMQIIKGSKAFTHRSPLALNAIMDRFQNTL